MYMKQLASLTEYLAGARRDVDEICRHLILDTFQAINPRSIYLGEIESAGEIRMRASFGYNPLQIERWGRIPLNANIPLTDAVVRNKCIVIPSQKEFFDKYPAVRDLGEIDLEWKSAIAVPILPIGAFFLVLHGDPREDSEFDSFLRAVGHLLVIAMRNQSDTIFDTSNPRSAERIRPASLTPRQEIITELIAKGYTNMEISREIGYSESLIRQETIAIYAFKNVSGRKELIRKMEVQDFKA